MPPAAVTILKFVFLALLYLFVYRALRSVVVDVRAAAPPRRRSGAGRSAAPPTVDGRSSRRRSKPPRRVVVVDETGAKAGTFALEGPLQVGRAEACHIRLSDSYISQFHARLFSRDDTWMVEDLGSTNGTFLNERKVTAPSEVHVGDRLRLGRTVLELRP